MAIKLGREIWIVAAKRTACGAFGGALKDMTATDLAVVAASAAIASAGISAGAIEEIIFGNVQQAAADAIYLARHVGLRAGAPIPSPALTLNRLCGSGFQAVISGAQQILLVDWESSAPIDEVITRRVLAGLERRVARAQAVILSDYGKGMLVRAVLDGVIAMARKAGVPVLVDPKGNDYARYRGATLVTPNRKEAEEALGRRLRKLE